METTKRDNNGGEESTKEYSGLPPEIITEILLRLPARSIGKFRCVSKLFCSLSSDPRFAKSHLGLTSARSSHRKLIVSSRNLYSVDLDSIGEGIGDLDSVELNYPLKEDASIFNEMIRSYLRQHQIGGESCVMPKLDSNSCRRSWVEIIGSSNGLVCISPRENDLFLCNLTTGESKRLPTSPILESEEEMDRFESYGFGYDDMNDDYKVVNLIGISNGVMFANVYSLKAGLYRRICDLNYAKCNGFDSGVHFNGSIHWVLTSYSQRVLVLVAFDLRTEEFREMQLPDQACDHRFKSFAVGNLNGHLCVVNSCYQEHDDIWVMSEYGEASSWSRIRISLLYRSMKPLCSTKHDEETLIELDGDMVLYNFKTGVSRNVGIRGVKPSNGFEADTYIESLVSPHSYGI